MVFKIFFLKVFVGLSCILWGDWYPLFCTSDDSAHGFQSQGGFIITCALLLLVHKDPQSHLWLPGLGIEPRFLAPEASMIPLHQPDPVGVQDHSPCMAGRQVNNFKQVMTHRMLGSFAKAHIPKRLREL